MPDFMKIYQLTLDNEGRQIEKVTGDKGGRTYWGISEANYPGWPGWKMIDAGQKVPDLMVQIFYQSNFWDRAACKFYQSDELAYQVYDHFVNAGGHAIFILRDLVGAPHDGMPVAGTTLNRLGVNKEEQDALAKRYMGQRQVFYRNLAVKDGSQGKFLDGWLARTQPRFLTA